MREPGPDHSSRCQDPVLLNLWHPLGEVASIPFEHVGNNQILGVPLRVARASDGSFSVHERYPSGDRDAALPTLQRYGYLWTSLGSPRPLFDIPEADEPDRRVVHACSVMVHTSAPRSVENFLDLGHFPFVHPAVLGSEPRTEVKDYTVRSSAADQEILATDCLFYQPQAALGSTGGAEVEYTFRVPHPHCAVLYKSSPDHTERLDAITLFVQALDEEHIRAHMLLCLLDNERPDWALRRFQISIFSQDKPILENQQPRRLPLDPRAETPIRADKSAVAYRRWLRELNVTYGVLPAAA